MKQIEIYPLFPSNIFLSEIEGDIFFDDLKKENYCECDKDGLYVTKNVKILDRYQDLKLSILEHFTYIIKEILKYNHTQFDITTSWMNLSTTNSIGEYHSHQNSFYSGVMYFEDYDDIDNCGSFEIDSMNMLPGSITLSEPTEYNIYNSTWWHFKPRKNLVIFFPSYLKHRIGKHKSNISRYSLAFNIMPYGTFGFGDSSISMNLNNTDSLQSIRGKGFN